MYLLLSRCVALLSALLIPGTVALESITSNKESLLWGPYRSNHYLGIRPRIPESLIMGLMWGKLGDEQLLRHTCSAKDGMAGWGWTSYDSRTGGSQTMHDVGNGLDLTTEFVKTNSKDNAGNWALRISGTPRKNERAGIKTEVVFYVGMEGMQNCFNCELVAAAEEQGSGNNKFIENVDIKIRHPGLGNAMIHIPNPRGQEREARKHRTVVHQYTGLKSINVTEDILWQSNPTYLKTLQTGTTLFRKKSTFLPNEPSIGNMHFVQLVFQDSFEFDVFYSSEAAPRSISSAEFTSEIENTLDTFNSRFSSVFRPNPPFNSESHITFSKHTLSNLLGGLSYFHGGAQVDETQKEQYAESSQNFWKDAEKARSHSKPQTKGPLELLSHVPSRSFFPRGFLWDEGFHLLLVVEWDLDLALEIVRSWLNLIDADGWIAREQIMGPEARSKVPEQFVVQYPHIANPPTLFWIVGKYVDMLSRKTNYTGHDSVYLTQEDASTNLLAELYPLLKRHYEWWRKSQSGDLESHSLSNASTGEAYRWRGRTPGSNLASGLDDFPRTEPPDPTELHVDALCWVGVMASTLASIAQFTGNIADDATYQGHFSGVAQNIEAVHWSEREQAYCDTVVFMGQHTFSCAIGYVSLFPLITGFLGPRDARLGATLDLVRNPDELWTDYGIRSLSRSDPRYRSLGDYWRSPIWLNLNYMVIEALLVLAQQPGPQQQRCRQIYTELRDNVLRTTYTSWKETGFVWEQYNAGTGAGQATQGFTGWTALVVKIMAFPDLTVEGEERKGFRDKFESLVEATSDNGWGLRRLVVGVMLLGSVWLTRRKFARLIRGLMRY